MCSYVVRIFSYQAGLEDGFDVIPSKNSFILKPYVYNESGTKEYINSNDKIFIFNNTKQVIK